MDDNQFIDEEIEDYTETSKKSVHLLSSFLKLLETSTFSLTHHLNPNNPLHKIIFNFTSFLEDRKIKNMHSIGRKAATVEEQKENDRVINKMTCSFLPEIEKYLEQENITLPNSEAENINHFLYLINANYFDEIKSRNSNVRREFLIEQLLYVISFHITNNKLTFDEITAQNVLDTCVFIPEDIKRQIISEFKKSKIKIGPFSNYEIIRRDIDGGEDSYLEAHLQANKNRIPEWNLDVEDNFIILMEALEVCEDFQELGIGSAQNLSWDLPFIQRMLKQIHTNYRRELITLNEEYSSFDLTWDYLFTTMAYAVANNVSEVTSDVAVSVFGEWDYIPFDLKLRILDEIFETEKIDYCYHPYRDKKPKNKKIYQKKMISLKQETKIE